MVMIGALVILGLLIILIVTMPERGEEQPDNSGEKKEITPERD